MTPDKFLGNCLLGLRFDIFLDSISKNQSLWCHLGDTLFQGNITSRKARECGRVGGDIMLSSGTCLRRYPLPHSLIATTGRIGAGLGEDQALGRQFIDVWRFIKAVAIHG